MPFRHKRSRTHQPATQVGADIGGLWGSPSFVWYPASRFGVDAISKRVPANTGGGTVGVGLKGRAYTAAVGAGNGLDFGAVTSTRLPIAHSTSKFYTIAALAAPASSASRTVLYSQGSDFGSPWNQLALWANANNGGATAGKFALTTYDGGYVFTIESTASQVDGNWHLFSATRCGSTSGYLFRDGVDVSSSISGSGGTPSAPTVGNVMACGIHGNSYAANYPVALVVVWPFAFTPTQHKQLPFLIWDLVFERLPGRRVISQVEAVGGGGGSGFLTDLLYGYAHPLEMMIPELDRIY